MRYLQNDKWLPIIYFIVLFLFIQIFDLIEWKSISFIVKNIFLLLFLYYYINIYRKSNPNKWLLNPVVLASLITFLLGYCITNYVYFMPGSEDEKLMIRLLGSEPLAALNKGMNAVIIAAIAVAIAFIFQLISVIYFYKFNNKVKS
jgi:hypothetical protein